MLSKEQIHQIERSYKHSNCLVFCIENGNATSRRVFVAETFYKHPKEATIEMVDCAEIDESCFEPNGDYYGDVTNAPLKNIILDDPCVHNDYCVASVYYEDEVREVFNQTTRTIEVDNWEKVE